ncbi:rod shape-determining protein RodA [bacterium (Candidatus Gribaldobacteria) CG_4_9_14_3_um_filter_36_15]|uniref:Rod shape-determining protein RodA n=2 Tax=Candidatus Gribaldobacteria TaxID=2798536 RepID=A0A2M7VJT1_9BACT|nr:MAG: rod shape-determining protein RodA [Parcubacteria group bacterium CG2_30_36_21]PIU42970.1 MAG: rod shape-determining protein RodA [Parcubacteria group bacterium CG07_land_8_20_14_0_80_35_11]PJA02102.1 MAG: rod shape-determining protein RodA [bacterium (Candidatus Gribaldobacteria) CG_4_10_14_0_2_um_filter_36_18]PJB09338.1 MAG: rod shape-determining protein RodA [bacterium (Candidatus Gribaldobacteria) CG_4_9_14_3_um_filter_36_15]
MLISHLKKIDWLLVSLAVFLTSIGLLEIYNICSQEGNFLNFKKQLIFFILGLFLIILFSFFDYRILRTNSYLVLSLYILALVSLIGLFFLGTEMRGVKGWYNFGSFSFDPVPFMAVILIVVLSKYFSRYHVEIYRFRHIFFSGIYVLMPAVLIFLQPDLGSTLILIFLWVGIVILSGVKLSHFLILILVFSLIFIISWAFILKDYQKQRFISFLNPQIDEMGISWNINQSKIAIGSGGLLGKGIGKGSQSQYGFLPEAHTDFIFSALAEETGLLGVSVLFFVFLILLFKIIKIALNSKNNFVRLFASGFAFLLFSQIFINIGMSLGLLPIVGISLPLVSYGGSQLLALYSGLGLLQSMKING